ITVPAKVNRRELKASEHNGCESTSHREDEPYLRHASVSPSRRDVRQHHRRTTKQKENRDCGTVAKQRQRLERRRELRNRRRPEREVLSQVKVRRDQDRKHRRLDREQQVVSPPHR